MLDGLKLTLTWTVALRSSGDLIEKLGISPDIICRPTQADIASMDPFRGGNPRMSGYQFWKARLLGVLDKYSGGSFVPAVERCHLSKAQLDAMVARHQTWKATDAHHDARAVLINGELKGCNLAVATLNTLVNRVVAKSLIFRCASCPELTTS